MIIAVLGDLHLPDRDDTVKEKVFDWVLAEIAAREAGLIVSIGDLTALGTGIAARRITDKLAATGIPFLLAPGNAELRSPSETAGVQETMRTAGKAGKAVILDSAAGKLSPESAASLRMIAAGNETGLLLFTHYPPAAWAPEDREVLEQTIRDGKVVKVVYGHLHTDVSREHEECIRGLDPDKAVGGAPALVIFKMDSRGNWSREDIPCPEAMAEMFPDEEKKRFLASLGISGMKDPLAGLVLATEKKLPVFEIRFSREEYFLSGAMLDAVARWRQSGGKYLSLHLPDLKFDGENFSGQPMLKKAADAAVTLGCDGVTFHVPRCFADQLNTPEAIARAAQEAADVLSVLFDHNISIGVENLHTSLEERINKRYKFGCTGAECLAFIRAMRDLRPGKKIGLHLDIGHARNNRPFSSYETLSDWYAVYGKEIVSMHVHQVRRGEGGEFNNHTGFDDFYGELISLSSLAMARRAGQIGDVPMILELRCPPQNTLEILINTMQNGKKS